MEFKENDFVRVPITKELIANFFTNGVRHFEVTGGITEEFECIGCVQDPLNAIFYLMFRKGQPLEGLAATQLLPTYFRLNEKFIEKEKVREAIEGIHIPMKMPVKWLLQIQAELKQVLNLEEK